MKLIFAFLIVIVLGYASGLALEFAVEGELSKISKLSGYSVFSAKAYSFVKSAELSSALQGIIDHASISIDVGPQHQDPTPEEPDSGDEFFLNKVNECVFHSGESISGSFFFEDSLDDGICIVCKLRGDCQDVYADFVTLEHGSKIGAINTILGADGVIVSAKQVFDNSKPKTLIVYDGATIGGPDPDLEEDGTCTGCQDLHMIVFPEDIIDNNFDGLVDIPNDSAAGGIQRYQFDQPRKIVSFDFVDHDSSVDGYAKAYSDKSCTQQIGSAVTIPKNQADGSIITIVMDKDDARCLEIEYHDSGGVTNLILECLENSDKGTTIASSQVDLVNGYTASEKISIPFDNEMVSINDFESVELEIISTILDYQGLDHGEVLNTQFLADYGVKISGYAYVNGDLVPRDPIVFNTNLENTDDPDLEVDIGNISIVQENTVGCGDGICNEPDDNADGGVQKWQFDPVRYVNSLVFVDADRPYDIGTISLYSDYDCTNLIDDGEITIPSQEGVEGNLQVLVPLNIEKVGCMIADYGDSGGISRINLGCPLPDDPLIGTLDGGGQSQGSSEETIYYFDYENTDEKQKWTASSSKSGHHFGIILGDDFNALSGSKVLAGWGNFDPDYTTYVRQPLDISSYHDVVLSVWYSYEDTESDDEFFFYYKDGSTWVPIFLVDSPNSSSSQSDWQNQIVEVPAHIDSLQLRFRWSTSSDSEHVMIDNLEILGTLN